MSWGVGLGPSETAAAFPPRRIPRRGLRGVEGTPARQPDVRHYNGRHRRLDGALGVGFAILGYGTACCAPTASYVFGVAAAERGAPWVAELARRLGVSPGGWR
ncbi:3-(3-hydroxy-phenyl)propanoic acid hydroxylase [Nocardia gamkensis]|nr:3-(3-hydroxy-phenyl)propanoic acid hydroxylase [Nocardia gamkensis]